MKKTYHYPSMNVIELKITCPMLAGSENLTKSDTEITDGTKILSRSLDFDDEEDW